MKGNNENGESGDNDNNNPSVETNLSTSPPRKKQCLAISSSSSKPDNEGLHGSEPDLVGGTLGTSSKDVTAQKQGVGETEKQPLGMVQDQLSEEAYSESSEETYSDSESDKNLSHYDEDDWFTEYDRLRDDRKIYVICLKEEIRSRSLCKEYLKKIGCDSESNFLGGSKGSPKWFYARLTDDEAEKLAGEEGVRSLSWKFFIGW